MMRFLALVFLMPSYSAIAEMIFIDLNDAGEEIAACREGIQEAAKKSGQPDDLHVVRGVAGDVRGRSKTSVALRAKIEELLAKGVEIDSLVISGDDGFGKFSGSEGDFLAGDLKKIVADYPQIKKSLKTSAVWGCYPSTAIGAEQFWLNNLGSMQFTMGFTGQGPRKDRPANHFLLKQFCERRKEAAQATTLDALCDFKKSLKHLEVTTVGLCNKAGVAAADYAIPGQANECFTYSQLQDRCPQFANDPQLLTNYERYMTGEAEFPAQGEPEELRGFYNKLHLYRHCIKEFKSARGTDMPYPPNVIRLIKYNKVKQNLMEKNKGELTAYDRQLDRVGLSALKVGDITKLSRKELNTRIEKAISALSGKNVEVEVPGKVEVASRDGSSSFMFSAPARSSKLQTKIVRVSSDPPLLRMAQCMKMTLVTMDSACTSFDMVGDHARKQSACLLNYEEAKTRNPNDDC